VIARTMTVNVTPVNDAPSGADATVVTLEDTAYTFGVTDFGFSDRDGNAFLAVRIAALPTAGSLALAGAAVTAGQVVSVAAIAAGDLTLSPAANANGTAYASFAFQVQDAGGTANGGVDTDVSARTLTLNVTSVNDAPAGADTTVKAREDTAYTFSVTDFGYTDPSDNAPNVLLNVKIGVLAGAGSLTLGGVAVSPGQIIPVARITAGELQFMPARGGTGTGYATLTFQLQDDGGVAGGGADSDGTPRTITVDVIRTKFPDESVPGGPVIAAEQPAQAPAAAAAADDSKTSEADARAKSTLAKIAASLAEALAQTRVVAGNDIDAQVSVLSATPPPAADAVSPRSSPSSASARAVVNGAIVVAPDLLLETKPEGAISMIAVAGVRAGAAPGAAVVENAAEEADPKKQAYAMLTLENGVRASAIIVSAGMVSWTLQGAGLIASLLTSAPAWRHLDPMPVLAPEEEKPDWGENDDDAQREEDAADSMWRIDAKRRTVS
ncbi:MAG: hypothetical protein JWO70_1704, partial [Betaproteobacteria bacterium]|nr:hypothetical protein [Betaproteobacteria bacterium]